MNKSVVACVEDMLFRSKIDATAGHLNVPVKLVSPTELSKAVSAIDFGNRRNERLDFVNFVRDWHELESGCRCT